MKCLPHVLAAVIAMVLMLPAAAKAEQSEADKRVQVEAQRLREQAAGLEKLGRKEEAQALRQVADQLAGTAENQPVKSKVAPGDPAEKEKATEKAKVVEKAVKGEEKSKPVEKIVKDQEKPKPVEKPTKVEEKRKSEPQKPEDKRDGKDARGPWFSGPPGPLAGRIRPFGPPVFAPGGRPFGPPQWRDHRPLGPSQGRDQRSFGPPPMRDQRPADRFSSRPGVPQAPTFSRPVPGPRAEAPQPDSPEQKLRHLREAAEHLAAAGMREQAQDLIRHVERAQAEMQRQAAERARVDSDRRRGLDGRPDAGPAPAMSELAGVLRELRQEVSQLRREVQELRSHRRQAPPGR